MTIMPAKMLNSFHNFSILTIPFDPMAFRFSEITNTMHRRIIAKFLENGKVQLKETKIDHQTQKHTEHKYGY